MPRLRHSLLAGHAITCLLVLALAAGMCGSADVVSVHTAHGRDVEGAPSRALACVSVVPPGEVGTTILTGFDGYACAPTGNGTHASAAATISLKARINIIDGQAHP